MGLNGFLCLFLAVHLEFVASNLTKKIKVIDGFVSSKNNLVDINEVLLFRIGTRQIDFTINVQEQDPSLQNCSGRYVFNLRLSQDDCPTIEENDLPIKVDVIFPHGRTWSVENSM